LNGIAPVRVASGKRFSVLFRWAQSSNDSLFTSSLRTRSVTVPGLKPTIKPKSPEAKITTSLFGLWPLNGSASCLLAGKIASPTIPISAAISLAYCQPQKVAPLAVYSRERHQEKKEYRLGTFHTSLGGRPSILAEPAPRKVCGLFQLRSTCTSESLL
jgi:hypothetical protein